MREDAELLAKTFETYHFAALRGETEGTDSETEKLRRLEYWLQELIQLRAFYDARVEEAVVEGPLRVILPNMQIEALPKSSTWTPGEYAVSYRFRVLVDGKPFPCEQLTLSPLDVRGNDRIRVSVVHPPRSEGGCD